MGIVTSKVIRKGTIAYKEYRRSNGCPNIGDTALYDTHYYHTQYRVDNPKDQRVMPEVDELNDFLFLHPTPQPKQILHNKYGGIVQKVSRTGAWCDTGEPPDLGYWYSFPVVERAHVYAVTPVIDLSHTQLDWQTKMRLDIKDTAVNLGVSLVEFRETCNMFSSFAKGVSGAWRKFHKKLKPSRRSGQTRATPCNVAAAELVYSYGIEPLANDLYDSFQVLQNKLQLPIYRKFISTKKESELDFLTDDGAYEYSGSWFVGERAICYVRLVPDYREFILGNPAELVWEKIPFSFVVDWAIPVGDYLSALDALKDVESVVGTVTRKERYIHDAKALILEQDGYRHIEVPCRTTYRTHERTVINDIPVPTFPSWDPSASWRRVVHGISLLTVLNQKCKPKPQPPRKKRMKPRRITK